MDAPATQLVRSLTKSIQELSLARASAADINSHIKYAELTGRIETMHTIISFFQQTEQTNQPQTGENPPAEKVDDGDQQEETTS